jgi:hypothetical protein
MSRQLTIALVTMLAMLGPSLAHADGPIPTFVGCPAGQAIRGINFITRALVCAPVGGDTTALLARIATLEGQVAGLQSALTSALGATPCLHSEGTDVFFDGCNVHIRSGSGSTEGITAGVPTVNGLGNLIVGYNDDPDPFYPPAVRTGSHNLVVGPAHTYSSYGGFLAGRINAVTGPYGSVSGGEFNKASDFSASVSGGHHNTASGYATSVSGGLGNLASVEGASVSGGVGNTASRLGASVSGGTNNTASGEYASVSGGENRSASGRTNWAAGSLHEDH